MSASLALSTSPSRLSALLNNGFVKWIWGSDGGGQSGNMCAAGRVRQSIKQTSLWFGLVCLGYFSSLPCLPFPHSVPWLWGWLGLDRRHQKTHLGGLPFPVPMTTDDAEEWMLQMFLGPNCLFSRSRGEKIQVYKLIKHHPRKDTNAPLQSIPSPCQSM